jgi:hypothetical protein
MTTTTHPVICNTPNGREVRLVDGRYEVQPHNDNYWISCASVAEAMYRYRFPDGDPSARTIARMIVDSWGSDWSISETARVGVAEADVEAAAEYATSEDMAVAIVAEIESICRERSVAV